MLTLVDISATQYKEIITLKLLFFFRFCLFSHIFFLNVQCVHNDLLADENLMKISQPMHWFVSNCKRDLRSLRFVPIHFLV